MHFGRLFQLLAQAGFQERIRVIETTLFEAEEQVLEQLNNVLRQFNCEIQREGGQPAAVSSQPSVEIEERSESGLETTEERGEIVSRLLEVALSIAGSYSRSNFNRLSEIHQSLASTASSLIEAVRQREILRLLQETIEPKATAIQNEFRKRMEFVLNLNSMFQELLAGVEPQLPSIFRRQIQEAENRARFLFTSYQEQATSALELWASLNNGDVIVALRKKLEEEIQKCSELPFVRRIAAMPEGVLFVLDDVEIIWQQKKYFLGPYELMIKVKKHPSSQCLSLRSLLVGAVDTPQHPHVRNATESGICWGNGAEAVLVLLGENRFSELLLVVWQFLHSYNPGSRFIQLEDLVKKYAAAGMRVIER